MFRLSMPASRLFAGLGEHQYAVEWRDEAFRLCQIVHADNEELLYRDYQEVSFDLIGAKEYEKALHLMRKGMAIRERLFGQDELAGDKYWIAWTLYASGGSAAEEEELLLSAMDTSSRKYGHVYSETIRIKHQLAAVYRREQRFQDAEHVLLGILDSLSSAEPINQATEKDTMRRLIRVYESWSEAESNGGYAEQAAHWQAKLLQLDAVQPKQSTSP